MAVAKNVRKKPPGIGGKRRIRHPWLAIEMNDIVFLPENLFQHCHRIGGAARRKRHAHPNHAGHMVLAQSLLDVLKE